jgi:hypothetical protein
LGVKNDKGNQNPKVGSTNINAVIEPYSAFIALGLAFPPVLLGVININPFGIFITDSLHKMIYHLLSDI